jgi:hypothetical protein
VISSGDGMNSPRSSQREVEVLPRRAMSSVNEVRRESLCSIRAGRGAMNDPEPWRCTMVPSSASAWMALRTVTRDTSVMLAISRSGGSGLPGARMPCSTPSERRFRNWT